MSDKSEKSSGSPRGFFGPLKEGQRLMWVSPAKFPQTFPSHKERCYKKTHVVNNAHLVPGIEAKLALLKGFEFREETTEMEKYAHESIITPLTDFKNYLKNDYGYPNNIVVTSAYRCLGTDVPKKPNQEPDTCGERDQGDAKGHWRGMSVDLTTKPIREYYMTLYGLDETAFPAEGYNDLDRIGRAAGMRRPLPVTDPMHWTSCKVDDSELGNLKIIKKQSNNEIEESGGGSGGGGIGTPPGKTIKIELEGDDTTSFARQHKDNNSGPFGIFGKEPEDPRDKHPYGPFSPFGPPLLNSIGIPDSSKPQGVTGGGIDGTREPGARQIIPQGAAKKQSAAIPESRGSAESQSQTAGSPKSVRQQAAAAGKGPVRQQEATAEPPTRATATKERSPSSQSVLLGQGAATPPQTSATASQTSAVKAKKRVASQSATRRGLSQAGRPQGQTVSQDFGAGAIVINAKEIDVESIQRAVSAASQGAAPKPRPKRLFGRTLPEWRGVEVPDIPRYLPSIAKAGAPRKSAGLPIKPLTRAAVQKPSGLGGGRESIKPRSETGRRLRGGGTLAPIMKKLPRPAELIKPVVGPTLGAFKRIFDSFPRRSLLTSTSGTSESSEKPSVWEILLRFLLWPLSIMGCSRPSEEVKGKGEGENQDRMSKPGKQDGPIPVSVVVVVSEGHYPGKNGVKRGSTSNVKLKYVNLKGELVEDLVYEDDVNKGVANSLVSALKNKPGIKVVHSPGEHLVPRVARAADAFEEYGSRLRVAFIDVHCNKDPKNNPKTRGTRTFIASEESKSKGLGDCIHKSAVKTLKDRDKTWVDGGLRYEVYGIMRRGVAAEAGMNDDEFDRYYVVLAELGFLSSKEDATILAEPGIQTNLGRAVADAVVEWAAAMKSDWQKKDEQKKTGN
jgi:N-acetylmuramoyl-L-alanine amidase